jgi:superfamily II DNA/RNA helicase
MSTISSKLKVAALAIFLGTARFAAAQSPGEAQTFANQLQQYQALSGTGTYTFHAAPKFSNTPQDPIDKESFSQRFADMQAESSNDSDMWQETQPTLSAKAADPEPKESFAQRFGEMQAASSNSGEWAFQPGANVPADETNSTLVVAKPISPPAQPPVLASQK